jgi:hypothetical protein
MRRVMICSRHRSSPSTGTPGEGWGGGSVASSRVHLRNPLPNPPSEYRWRELSATRTRTVLAFFLMLATGALLCGCETVKPWQRGLLADPIMQPDRNPMQAEQIEHVYFSREAASGDRTVGGGGCGCN